MIRILVVDDQKSVRERLIASLQTETDFQIVGTANDGYTAIEQVEVHRPDVVLLDMQMPNLDGVSATKIICQRFLGIKILMYSVHDNEDYISRALLSGAVGYLVKGSPDEELSEAIRFIYRGYTQIRPGWLDNLTALEPTYGDEVEDDETAVSNGNGVNGSNGNGVSDRGQLALRQQYEPQFLFGSVADSGKSGSWKNYIVPWLIANLIVWSAGLLYLRLAKPTYASSWAIALSAQNVTTNFSLPDIGETSSRTESAFNQESADPRENYKFLAETDEVIAKAAKKLKMTPDEFGKPTIKIVDNTTLMKFQVKGDTPEQAQKKAKAIKQAFQEELAAKRDEEMVQQNGNLTKILNEAEQKLIAARQKLTEYQESSGVSSKEQVKELSTNVEALRRQQSEESARFQKANSRYNRLLQDLGLTPAQAGDAFVLQSDRRFQKYLAEYSNLSGEEIALNAKYF
ncbi:MAG: response regulator, partial [Xenococcaceae cyanobacterium]